MALHLARGGMAGTASALPHLLQAGRDALARRADPEAAAWLGDALAIVDRLEDAVLPSAEHQRLLEDVAVARQRMGQSEAAQATMQRAFRPRC